MNKKIDFSILKNAEVYKVSYIDTNKIDANYVKRLREKLNMTQLVFASVLGVKKKTIEKWEQGKNPVSKPTALLMYLIDNNEDVLKMLYNVELNPNFNEYTETEFESIEDFGVNNDSWVINSKKNVTCENSNKNEIWGECPCTA